MQVIDLNQSQSSIVTVSAVHLLEEQKHMQIPPKQSSKHMGSKGNSKASIMRNHIATDEDIESNIDYIDLETEDEYESSIFTKRSISLKQIQGRLCYFCTSDNEPSQCTYFHHS